MSNDKCPRHKLKTRQTNQSLQNDFKPINERDKNIDTQNWFTATIIDKCFELCLFTSNFYVNRTAKLEVYGWIAPNDSWILDNMPLKTNDGTTSRCTSAFFLLLEKQSFRPNSELFYEFYKRIISILFD